MPRTRRVDCGGPGWSRRPRGRGFELLDENQKTIGDRAARERVRSLAIPPAWTDGWINPDPRGHIQATGLDDAGRRQYRYHDDWSRHRSLVKFNAVLDFARRLPNVREDVAAEIATAGLSEQRVLAGAVRLLDLGFFRIGCESYA